VKSLAAGAPAIYMEDWAATYGPSILVDPEAEVTDDAELVEDGPGVLAFHAGLPDDGRGRLAFVDGVRRGEGALYLDVGGTFVNGVAGAHGVGAAVLEPGRPFRFERCEVTRMVILGGGERVELPEVANGYRWTTASTPKSTPTAPLDELQVRMRAAEGRLAEELCAEGYLTLVDGPLFYVRSRDVPVVGVTKTHHRRLLPLEHHVKVGDLGPGERTSLFRMAAERFSAYVRLAPRTRTSGPWAGIVRIEVPSAAGLAEAVAVADQAAGLLPRFAGVAHVDPRAPQNLQPTGALERHLRHLLGDTGLATRAIRASIAALTGGGGDDVAPPATSPRQLVGAGGSPR
jgi:hypothetical protein